VNTITFLNSFFGSSLSKTTNLLVRTSITTIACLYHIHRCYS